MEMLRLGCREAQLSTSGRAAVISERGWAREFDDPIALPDGGRLVTLLDAGNYIIGLPESVHTAAEWQAAMEALILVADLGGPTMFAHIGVMKALNLHVERGLQSGSQRPSLAKAEPVTVRWRRRDWMRGN
jgi:hypothetical protein